MSTLKIPTSALKNACTALDMMAKFLHRQSQNGSNTPLVVQAFEHLSQSFEKSRHDINVALTMPKDPPTHRILAIGELIEPDDEIYGGDDEWFPVKGRALQGGIVSGGSHFRRKLTGVL